MTTATPPDWNWRHAAALLAGNIALAFGPWSVRLSDAGSVATAFWRLALALPLLAILALANRQPLTGFARHTWLAMIGAGAFFALNLAAWHIGMSSTRLGNATLFGNASSIILMVCGLIAVRRAPSIGEWLALLAAGVWWVQGRRRSAATRPGSSCRSQPRQPAPADPSRPHP